METSVEEKLKELHNHKFRVTKVELPHKDRPTLTMFYAEISSNNKEWFPLKRANIGKGIFIYPYPKVVHGSGCMNEEEALLLIKEFKKKEEESIRKQPMLDKQYKEAKEYLAKREKEKAEEMIKYAPKTSHKYL